MARHSVIPWLGSPNRVLLVVGIAGATIMPHAAYMHSALTWGRVVPGTPEEAPRIHRFELIDVVVARGVASPLNTAILYMAAALLHAAVHSGVADFTTAFRTGAEHAAAFTLR